MKEKDLKETGLADMAYKVDKDHEVQMARADLYKIAKYGIKLHEMLAGISEEQGLDGWVQAKITKAADYLGSVYHHLDYETKFDEVTESKKADKFKPHMMYDPKTGKSKHAKVEKDHLDMKAKGWSHDKPKDIKEDVVQEAYVNTSKDAVEVLANLRKIGKSIERGQGEYEGNLANEYANDVWDVYTFIEARTNRFQGIDKNAKAAIDAMMELRGEAKKLETEPGSGSNGRFGNQIATVLYPVMEYLYTTKFDRNKELDDSVAYKESLQAKLAERVNEALKKKSKVVCSECNKPSYTTLSEEKQKGVDGKVCWKGYKRMGTKQKGGKTVDNCVKA